MSLIQFSTYIRKVPLAFTASIAPSLHNVDQRILRQHKLLHNASTSSTERLGNGRSSSYWNVSARRMNYYRRFYERYKSWGLAIGILTIGSIMKVVYFKYSRQLRIYICLTLFIFGWMDIVFRPKLNRLFHFARPNSFAAIHPETKYSE